MTTTAPRTAPHGFDAPRSAPALAPRGAPSIRRRRRDVPDTRPTLTVFRHDTTSRTLVVLAGEIDLASVPPLREALDRCLLDGFRTVDVDVRAVTFCDCSGLNALLVAAQRTASAGGSLRLRHPSAALTRLLALTGSGFLVASDHFARRRTGLAPPATALPGGAP